MAASTFCSTEFETGASRVQSVKTAASSSLENSNSGQSNVEVKNNKYSRLIPVRAIQTLMLYSASLIFAACEHLETIGRSITVDNLLDTVRDKHFCDIATRYAAYYFNDAGVQTQTFRHSENGAAPYKVLATNDQQGPTTKNQSGPATSNKDEGIKCHSETKTPKHEDMQQSKRALKSGHYDDQPLLKNEGEVQLFAEAQRLEAENKKIRESRLCSKCKERQADIILLPCRHVSVCHSCWNPQKKIPCPKCNMGVAGSFHVFWG